MNTVEFTNLKSENKLPFQVIGTSIHFEQNDIKRLKGYPYHQFVWFSEGNGIIKHNNKVTEIKSGTVVFIPKGTPHEYRKTTNIWISNWICFSGWACGRLLDELNLSEIKLFQIKNENKIISIMGSINSALNEDLLYGNETASSLLYSFIVEMNRMYVNIKDKYDKINCSPISKAIKYIDKNYSNKITIAELCAAARLSESQLCRLFQKHLNMRPMEYIFQARLKSAKELLIQSDLSILEIAEKVGYNNPAYFSMLFKKSMGIPPSEYRKMML